MSGVAGRTHTWLRLSLVGAVAVILLAVTIESVRIGELLPSLSHYYYSPARNVLVGALIAASVALLTLSGRNLESVLLDLAAPLAALAALVPTRTEPAVVPQPGLTCPPAMSACVPVQSVPDVDNGVTVFVIVVSVLVMVAVVLAARADRGERGEFGARARVLTAAIGGAVVVAGVLIAAVVPGGYGQSGLLTWVHVAASALFIVIVGAVAVLGAFFRTGSRPVSLRERMLSIAVAVLLLVDLGVAVWAIWFAPSSSSAVLWVEVAALVLIAVYFAVQTVARRDEVDPPSLAACVERLPPLRAAGNAR